MKKYYFIFIAFVGMLFFTSCSTDENLECEQVLSQESSLEYSKTLRDIELYNQQLSQKFPSTRSARYDNLIKADVLGGVYGASLGEGLGSYVMWLGGWGVGAYATCTFSGALLGAAAFSWKQYKRQSGCAITTMMTDDLYSDIKIHCENKTTITNNSFVCLDASDSIFNQLNIPLGYNDIEKVGIAHNKILHGDVNNSLPLSGPNNLNGGDMLQSLEEPIYPINNYCAQALFEDLDFADSYNDVLDLVDDYNDIDNIFDYSEFLNDYPLITTTATNILRNFFMGLDITPQNTTSIIWLVNSYIQIIESNNELTTSERKQLYLAFIVAVYSFDHWYMGPSHPSLPNFPL